MMPPHVTSIDTSNPREIRIEGASLVFEDPAESVRLTDLASGASIPFEVDIDDRWTGGDHPDPPPGAVQVFCTLRVRPQGLTAGQRVRLRYLDEDVQFTA